MKYKFLSLFVAIIATTALWAQNNIITYTATEKFINSFLDVGKTTFGPVITAHTFSNGIGTITCNGEITTIGKMAFFWYTGLTSVTIPNSVTTIGESAFEGCSGLTSITIPNSVTTIGDMAFYDCSGLASPVFNANNFAYMPESYIGAYTIPNGIKQIAGSAFYDCSGLTSVTIPNSVSSIGDGAFVNCTGLTSVTIPNSVTTIGDYAFERVNNIVYHGTATWSSKNENEYWGAKCMNGYVVGFLVYSDSTKTKICGCSTAAKDKIIIPKSVTTIGEDAFSLCTDLTSIVLHTPIEKIEAGAFYWCTNLKSITIPRSVTTIGEWAFGGCSNLTSVTFAKGSQLTTIGKRAFYGCSKLSSMTLPKSIAQIGESAFEDTPLDK